jgi:hypothetical protein
MATGDGGSADAKNLFTACCTRGRSLHCRVAMDEEFKN